IRAASGSWWTRPTRPAVSRRPGSSATAPSSTPTARKSCERLPHGRAAGVKHRPGRRGIPAPILDGCHARCDWRLAQLGEKPNHWSQKPGGRGKVGTYPRAGQGPVWAVPEESVDDGGGAVSVTVTVTVDAGAVSVTVRGSVTVVGMKKVAALLVRPVSAAGADSITLPR